MPSGVEGAGMMGLTMPPVQGSGILGTGVQSGGGSSPSIVSFLFDLTAGGSGTSAGFVEEVWGAVSGYDPVQDLTILNFVSDTDTDTIVFGVYFPSDPTISPPIDAFNHIEVPGLGTLSIADAVATQYNEEGFAWTEWVWSAPEAIFFTDAEVYLNCSASVEA